VRRVSTPRRRTAPKDEFLATLVARAAHIRSLRILGWTQMLQRRAVGAGLAWTPRSNALDPQTLASRRSSLTIC
jgi:hypothetical protein